MKKLFFVVGLLILNSMAFSQNRKCGIGEFKNSLISKDPNFTSWLMHQEAQATAKTEAYESAKNNGQLKTTTVVTIPIVFHIVLTVGQQSQLGGANGIKTRVISQLEVINQDFNRMNSDSILIPPAFKSLYGNAEIQFCLARRKPNGTSTEGFQIVTTTEPGYSVLSNCGSGVKHSGSTGGIESWDPTQYINVWVCNITDAGILGITCSPGWVSPDDVGIVLNFGAFGKKTQIGQFFFTGIDKGRTLTHEIGHLFQLRHIWGDDGNSCAGTDDVNDTPNQADENSGACPTFPEISCSNGPNGDMFMNYMDYVNDACMQMFTIGQVARMKANIPVTLTTHPELCQWPAGIPETEMTTGFSIFPNPTTGIFQISLNNSMDFQSIQVINMMGQTVYETSEKGRTSFNIDLSGMSKGVYMVQCRFTSGTVTEKILLQ